MNFVLWVTRFALSYTANRTLKFIGNRLFLRALQSSALFLTVHCKLQRRGPESAEKSMLKHQLLVALRDFRGEAIFRGVSFQLAIFGSLTLLALRVGPRDELRYPQIRAYRKTAFRREINVSIWSSRTHRTLNISSFSCNRPWLG
jgi:hypothetical protein